MINKIFSAILVLTPFNAIAGNFIVGVNIHPQNDSNTVLAELRNANLRSFRVDFSWGRTEKKAGVYSIDPLYEGLDKIILSGEFNPVLILDYGNSIYGKDAKDQNPAFGNYVAWVASRYKGKVHYYEVWNEWNHQKNYSADDYVDLLKITYSNIKKIDPTAIVIAGSAAGNGEKFLPEIVARTQGHYFDGLSMHPYNFASFKNKPEDMLASLDRVQLKLRAMTGRDVPFYVTEIGWPNFSGKGGGDWRQTADYVNKTYSLACGRGYIKGIWWYELIDGAKEDSDKEHGFGLMTFDGIKKPGLDSLKASASMGCRK